MSGYLPQIAVLRVLAMGGVFVFHLWSVLPEVGAGSAPGRLFALLLAQGHLGVVVFNAITGFVLTLPLALRGDTAPLSTVPFFRRRFGRICPHYFLALALWSVVALVSAPEAWPFLARCIVEHALFVHTLDPACFFGIVPALWWMGLLAQFYVCYPLLLRLFFRLGPGKALLAVSLGCYGFWWLLTILGGSAPDSPFALPAYMVYFNLPARLPEFAVGMALAFWWSRRQGAALLPSVALPALLGTAALGVVLVVTLGELLPKPGVHLLTVLACLALCGALASLPLAARLGHNRVVAWLAGASFAIYLLHQPLLGLAVDLAGPYLPAPLTFAVAAAGAGSVTLVGAWLMDLVVQAYFTRKR